MYEVTWQFRTNVKLFEQLLSFLVEMYLTLLFGKQSSYK